MAQAEKKTIEDTEVESPLTTLQKMVSSTLVALRVPDVVMRPIPPNYHVVAPTVHPEAIKALAVSADAHEQLKEIEKRYIELHEAMEGDDETSLSPEHEHVHQELVRLKILTNMARMHASWEVAIRHPQLRPNQPFFGDDGSIGWVEQEPEEPFIIGVAFVERPERPN